MLYATIPYEQWWLMTCDFPDLNWARLRVYPNDSADVFDCDGRTTRFLSVEAAQQHLREDEYVALEDLETDEHALLSAIWTTIVPPTGSTDVELLPQMFRRAARIQEP